MLLPALAKAKVRAKRIKCVNNLKSIALSANGQDRLPWNMAPRQLANAYGAGNESNCLDIETLWTPFRHDLNTPKVLMSPCDPEVYRHHQAVVDEGFNWADVEASMQSYAVFLGASTSRPNNIIASSRNIDAHSEVEPWKWNWGTAAPNAKFGVTLWEDGELEGLFRGADEVGSEDEEEHEHGHSGPELEQIAMASLMKSQGQVALTDGSARQVSDAQLRAQLKQMMNSRGGATLSTAPFATRPFLEEDHGH